MNPQSSEPIPVEAIAGKVMTETGEITAVVTILHDRREAATAGMKRDRQDADAAAERYRESLPAR